MQIGTDQYELRLFLRLYAEVETKVEADALAQGCLEQLQIYAPITLGKVVPYWKIPEYYRVEIDFIPGPQATEVFDCVIALCPQGWTFTSSPPERSGVWNPVNGSVLLNERVKWANLELFYSKKT
jgi:hypothetical protein